MSERKWETTILYNRNTPGAYCFPSPFHCVAIDLVYALAVLRSALSITLPSETTTENKASVFNHRRPTPNRTATFSQHTRRRQAKGERNALHRTFRKWEFDVRQRAITFFFPCSFLPFSRSFWRLHTKNNPVAMVVEFLNTILGLYFGGLLLLHVTHVLSGRIGFFVWVSEGLAALKVLCYASLSNYKRKFAWIRIYYRFFVFGLAFAFPRDRRC